MRVTILGSGDAVGTPKVGCSCPACTDAMSGGKSWRFRPCILVSEGNINLLLDAGPDLRSQLLRYGISRIDGVAISHAHRDHYGGIGDFWRVQDNVPLYGEKRVLDYVRGEYHFMSFRWQERELYIPFMAGDMELTFFEVAHPPISLSTGIRIRHNGKTLIYTGDTSLDIPEKSMEYMKSPDLLLCDAIFPEGLRVKKHMNAEDAVYLSKKLNAKQAYFVHLSHHYPPHEEAIKKYPLAYDGQVIVL